MQQALLVGAEALGRRRARRRPTAARRCGARARGRPVPALVRRHDPRRHQRDPAQHHRRAGARPARVADPVPEPAAGSTTRARERLGGFVVGLDADAARDRGAGVPGLVGAGRGGVTSSGSSPISRTAASTVWAPTRGPSRQVTRPARPPDRGRGRRVEPTGRRSSRSRWPPGHQPSRRSSSATPPCTSSTSTRRWATRVPTTPTASRSRSTTTATSSVTGFAEAGLGALTLELASGTVTLGEGDATATVRASDFEALRAMGGRRNADQIPRPRLDRRRRTVRGADEQLRRPARNRWSSSGDPAALVAVRRVAPRRRGGRSARARGTDSPAPSTAAAVVAPVWRRAGSLGSVRSAEGRPRSVTRWRACSDSSTRRPRRYELGVLRGTRGTTTVLATSNAATPLLPASTQKLLVATAALGPSVRTSASRPEQRQRPGCGGGAALGRRRR